MGVTARRTGLKFVSVARMVVSVMSILIGERNTPVLSACQMNTSWMGNWFGIVNTAAIDPQNCIRTMMDFEAEKAELVTHYAQMRLSEATKAYAEDAIRRAVRENPEIFGDLIDLVKAETERLRNA